MYVYGVLSAKLETLASALFIQVQGTCALLEDHDARRQGGIDRVGAPRTAVGRRRAQ